MYNTKYLHYLHSNDLDETIYPRNQPLLPSRFRSHYAGKVRIDSWCQKIGCRQTMGPPSDPNPPCPQYYLRKHSRVPPVFFNLNPESIKTVDRPQVDEARAKRLEEERRARLGFSGQRVKIELGRRDFLEENALSVIRMPGRRTVRCYVDSEGRHRIDRTQAPFVLRDGYGKVPKYILQRKMQLYCEDLALQRSMEAAELPPNSQAISESHKQSLIRGLKERWGELNREYLKLPSYSNTQIDSIKVEMEDLMKEIENDIRLLQSTGQLIVNSQDPKSHYL